MIGVSEEWIINKLGRSFPKTLSLIIKPLKLKHCSRSSLTYVLSNKAVQKTRVTQEKKSTMEDKILKNTDR